jgi:hypothetical protein
MATNTQPLKHGWVWAFSILIFFFNYFLLPEGLSLVLLLTPLWLYLLYANNHLKITIPLLIPLFLYAPIHLMNGVSLTYYLISVTVIAALVFFVVAVYFLINSYEINMDLIFRDIAVMNFILTICCLPLLFIPALKETVWYLVPISDNIQPIPRLKLFMSEASHYSFLFAPVAIYFYSRVMFFKTSNAFLTLLIITVPLALSFSLGVMLGLFISGLLTIIVYFGRIFSSRKRKIGFLCVALSLPVLLLVAYYLFPNNPLFLRIHNIFNGSDTSARGRTYEAFILANKIAAAKSYWWGIGPGQLKLLGRSLVIEYYSYSKIPQTIRIPNACAETIAYFGYIGFAFRIFIELLLFVKTKVFANPYRLWLFLFVFIYQFTGSYITNVSEYIIWILAFSNVFPDYVNRISPQVQYLNERK